jgi:ubiquinone/menaquinone biosynthesis C-methylase UbiE
MQMLRRILYCVFLIALLPLLVHGSDEYQREADKLAELMNWKAGQSIAEIGSGGGQMSFSAAVRVGVPGHVYTTELDNQKLTHLKDEVKQRNLQNVSVIKADPIATNLPDNCCDDVFMRRVYHHLKDPAQTDAAILRALKPSGLLAVIDFPPREGLAGHGIPKPVLIEELKAAGFDIVSEPQDWPNSGDYCVIARKPSH